MPKGTHVPALPHELMREIADRCSLPTLVNLQLASKNWADACRGVGAKFRTESVGEFRDSALSEIREFAEDHVYARRSGGHFYFGIHGVAPPMETLAGGEGYYPPPEPATSGEIDAYVLRRWYSERKTLERRLFERAAESILRPSVGAAAAGIVVPSHATTRVRFVVFDSGIGPCACLRVATAAGSAEIDVDVESTATFEEIEEMLWAGPKTKAAAARLFRRRSARILATRRSSTDLVCAVDVGALVKSRRRR